ncbi:MAG: hypothetical protein COV75_01175 [Candidatus Omnitrophica bacterium CG11_big_fil_rev_8_21_14_0_20_63_9]|nr:MAG: hypothetical protein COV75_01175 [Candidatus Omnitrophica bacterium CG11_big_fil_rev_8_21_14_0_20_63_9]
MERKPYAGVAWFFAFVGGAIPLVFTITHIANNTPFGLEDVILWPTSLLLVGRELSNFDGIIFFAGASVFNIVLYAGVGKIIAFVLRRLTR